MRKLRCTSLLLFLTACAGTVSELPPISQQELQGEQAQQQQIIKSEQNRAQTPNEVMTREQMLKRLSAIGAKVAQAGASICQQTQPGGTQCVFPFALDKDDAPLNAYADGSKIVVAPAMMKFAYTDVQLATVLSHEYAHSIMGHPGKTQQNAGIGGLLGMAADALASSQGFSTGGAFSSYGQQAAVLRYSQGFEREADYIGMYILDHAGYDASQAAAFWRRMASLNPDSIFSGTTHPTTAERYLMLDKTYAEIQRKKTAGQPLIPTRLPQ